MAAVVLAGGQGTRLGFEGPKGAYLAGFPSGKSLFQMQIERLIKVRAQSDARTNTDASALPLYVMTSPQNDGETREFFENNGYFGMDKGDVFFFEQGVMPCVTDKEGKIMLETNYQVATAPDGNGGLFAALDKSGALADMDRRGVLYTHVFAIDNPLSCPGDPLFVGCCISKKVETGNLCVSKARWDERVGVAALRDGKFHVVEYSELTEDMAKKTIEPNADATKVDGSGLAFGAANICNHFFTVQFLKDKVVPGMKANHHAARKAIPYLDDPTPLKPNGIKLELFIFDAFPLAEKYIALQVDRETYFAPIKNATGVDSPETAAQAVTDLHKGWLKAAGAKFTGEGHCEISPLVSLLGEGLDKVVNGVALKLPLYIDADACVDLEAFASNNFRLVVDLSNSSPVTRYRVVVDHVMHDSSDVSVDAKAVLAKLNAIDLSKTTPLDALFLLDELKRMAGGGKL